MNGKRTGFIAAHSLRGSTPETMEVRARSISTTDARASDGTESVAWYRDHDSRSQDARATTTDRALRGGAAALLIVISVVHLHLWLAGYRHLATIGPLFLVAVVSGAVFAIVVAGRLNILVALAAASFAAGTLGANLLSLYLPEGLFRFKEVGISYSGGFAIASEIGVVALLGVWTYRRWRIEDQRPGSAFATENRRESLSA
jgi:hypothetical protein